MPARTVTILPQGKTTVVQEGKTLLEAVAAAGITPNSLCGGEGICGRCKMLLREGKVSEETSHLLTPEEIRQGFVLGCLSRVTGDVTVEIPAGSFASGKAEADNDAQRFKDFPLERMPGRSFKLNPLVRKLYLRLTPPTLENGIADHQNVCEAINRHLPGVATQMGLKTIQALPDILRANNYKITATVGLRRDVVEIMHIEGGNTEEFNYLVIVDIGTTTVVAHLVNARSGETMAAKACFNSQGIFGGEVTRRIIAAEKQGQDKLQEAIIKDLNTLVEGLSRESGVNMKDISVMVCVGNTVMSHFLLKLPTQYIRRKPYAPASTQPPPLRAAELGLRINSRGLLYSLPAVSGWVGSDITAGVLSTGIYRDLALSLLVDIGTNGEIVVGNRDWIMSTSASAGPALEGASVACGMRAESGAIEAVRLEHGDITWKTIGNAPVRGLCGSGIIDLVAVLLQAGVIDRSGHFVEGSSPSLREVDGIKRFVLTEAGERPVYISAVDLENIITAKAAIFAAIRIILKRLKLSFGDIDRMYLGGGFGNYLNIESAIAIGLVPDMPRDRIVYAGNTALKGAKMVALSQDLYHTLEEIARNTTYYDLMGANDYVEEFRKAMFLPHTDIDEFHEATRAGTKGSD